MPTYRRQGVFGYNLPPLVGTIVLPADFSVAGLVGRGARGLVSAVEINSTTELDQKMGGYVAGYYARYCADTFFINLRGQRGKLIWKGYVASNAVQASRNLVDGSAVNTIKAKAAWHKITDKSADGNKTGLTLLRGARFKTTIAEDGDEDDTSIELASVSDLRVGEELKITSTGPLIHYAKVSAFDPNTNLATISALTEDVAEGDLVEALGFRIQTYRKNASGTPIKTSLPEDKIWLSMEPENEEFYINTAFRNHPWLDLEDLASVSAGILSWPADITTPVFLASGADGTSPSSTNWKDLLQVFNVFPVRWVANSDSTSVIVNQDGEAYCNNRLDTPIWETNLPAQQSKDELLTLGRGYQRSDQVQMGNAAGWRNYSNPIGVGANPVVRIPCHVAKMGATIRSFYLRGFHKVAAGDEVPLYGFTETPDATEDQFTEDDRTDLVAAGINVIQFKEGRGLLIRSAYTFSTNIGSLFENYMLMQNFIKVSTVESLVTKEQLPNRFKALKEYAEAINDFGRKLFNGAFPFGIDPEGAFIDYPGSRFEDVWQVQANEFNNVQAGIFLGEGNIFVRFGPAPPLTSLGVGVGVVIPLF